MSILPEFPPTLNPAVKTYIINSPCFSAISLPAQTLPFLFTFVFLQPNSAAYLLDHLAEGLPNGLFQSTPYSCTLVLISRASESACSMDGDGETELDLEVNIVRRGGWSVSFSASALQLRESD